MNLQPIAPAADHDHGLQAGHETELAWETKVDLARLLVSDEGERGTLVAGRKGRRRPNAEELLRLANARILERCRRHGKIPARRASPS